MPANWVLSNYLDFSFLLIGKHIKMFLVALL